MIDMGFSSALSGRIRVVGDKSISHRALLLASLSSGKSEIRGFLRSFDTLHTLSCLRELGIEIKEQGDVLLVQGNTFKEPVKILDCGNSGTTLRLLTGILVGQPFFSILQGDSSLNHRPMGRIVEPLTQMGAKIWGRNHNSLSPLALSGGPLSGITYALPIASAQVKSALLLAGLQARGLTTLTGKIASRDHTERMLLQLGASLSLSPEKITLTPSSLTGAVIQVPGDFSSAAFFLCAALGKKGSHLVVEDVGLNPTRTALLTVLEEMGAKVEREIKNETKGEPLGTLEVRGTDLRGTTVSKDLIPFLLDEIPILAVLATQAVGRTRITGASELKVKESNRISAMVTQLRRLGASIQELPDGMEILGPTPLRGGMVHSYSDHRVAMSLLIAGLFAKKPVRVEDTECINVSYPTFFETLHSLRKS